MPFEDDVREPRETDEVLRLRIELYELEDRIAAIKARLKELGAVLPQRGPRVHPLEAA